MSGTSNAFTLTVTYTFPEGSKVMPAGAGGGTGQPPGRAKPAGGSTPGSGSNLGTIVMDTTKAVAPAEIHALRQNAALAQVAHAMYAAHLALATGDVA